MSAYPQYAKAPLLAKGQVTTANTNTDGSTGTYATILTTTGDTKVDSILIQGVGTTVLSVVRLFVSDNAGANFSLFDEIAVPATTSSNSAVSFRLPRTYGSVMPSGTVLKASVSVGGQALNVMVFGGTY